MPGQSWCCVEQEISISSRACRSIWTCPNNRTLIHTDSIPECVCCGLQKGIGNFIIKLWTCTHHAKRGEGRKKGGKVKAMAVSEESGKERTKEKNGWGWEWFISVRKCQKERPRKRTLTIENDSRIEHGHRFVSNVGNENLLLLLMMMRFRGSPTQVDGDRFIWRRYTVEFSSRDL